MSKGSILIADDDAAIRTVLSQALSRSGYNVRVTSNVATLWSWISSGDGDVVISDVVMPGMDGPTMVRAIRERLPEMPILFMSGYAEEQLRRDINIPDMHFIAKPFSVSAIGDKVSSVLRASKQEAATFMD